jgi:tetratricopeptide (TPR) repeat protein
MHRSGTSALTGALEAAGLKTGEVFRFGADNLKGHIESRLVIGINDAVLQHSGGSWREVPRVLRWTEAERRRRDAFVAAREAEGGAWLFKDPRTLLTLPFWREALPRLAVVGSFRHPLKVAFSLFQRNGLALDEGLRLWTDYNRRLVACWEEKPFPLLCFDLPEGAYRTAVITTVESLGTEIDAPLSGTAAVEFFSAQLRAAAIPKALLQGSSGGVADDLAAALDLYARLLTCAGVDHRLLIHTDHSLPLDPTIEGCRQLLADAPDNVMVLTLLATLLERAGDPEAACATRRDLVQLEPGNYLALRALLDLLEVSGLHKEALAWAERALLTHPDNPDLHLWLGNANLRQGDIPAALPHFRVARDADYAYLSCARELVALGDNA